MTNPLTTLDELIWKQFEKVTVAAEKRWGWDKWDLDQGTKNIEMTLAIGAGVYFTGYGFEAKSIFPHGILGIAAITLAGLGFYAYNTIIPQQRRKDEVKEFLLTGAVYQPQFSSRRPTVLGLAGTSFLCGTIIETYYKTLVSLPTDHLMAIASFLIGAGLSTHVAGEYFESQLPRPPSTAKKSLWQALADYVSKPFHKEPQPAEVPAAKYAVEQSTTGSHPLKLRA